MNATMKNQVDSHFFLLLYENKKALRSINLQGYSPTSFIKVVIQFFFN